MSTNSATFDRHDSLKSMRPTALIAISAFAALSVVGSASAAHGDHKAPAKCPPGHTHLIVADGQAEVYLRPEGSGPSGYEPTEIFGCTYADRRSYSLGGPPGYSSRGGGEATHYTLDGSILAYETYGELTFPAPEGFQEWHVVVENLRTGRVLHEVPTGTASAQATTSESSGIRQPRYVGVGPVVTLVVKSDGAVAWIVDNEIPAQHVPAEYEVHAVDKTGSRLLASGAEIDPHSLALAGSTLYWTQGGKPMSSKLN